MPSNSRLLFQLHSSYTAYSITVLRITSLSIANLCSSILIKKQQILCPHKTMFKITVYLLLAQVYLSALVSRCRYNSVVGVITGL